MMTCWRKSPSTIHLLTKKGFAPYVGIKRKVCKKKSWVDWIGLTGGYWCYHYSKDCLEADKWQNLPLKFVLLFTPAWWLFFAQKFNFTYSGENVLLLDCVPGWEFLFLRNDLSELCFSGWREGFASKVKLVCSLFRALQLLLQNEGRKDQKNKTSPKALWT